MALRDQPYLPLYIQDFLTDEKLIECSAKATGVYVRLMCIMHKSEDYGKILLKQKDKQKDKQIENFAIKLGKQMPYSQQEINDALEELLHEKVLSIEGDFLVQKRMVKDNALSLVRSEAGKKGANVKDFAKAKPQAKGKANSEYEIESEIDNDNGFNYQLKSASKKIEVIEIEVEQRLLEIFDEWYMTEKVRPAFRGIDIYDQLEKFKVKIHGSPGEYRIDDTDRIRNAFLYQLRQVKPEKKQTAPKKFTLDELNQ